MDFHALPRRDLQALCKRNSIRANMTNAAMADALGALPAVDGIEEYVVKQPTAQPTPAATAVVEDEKQGILLEDVGEDKQALKRDEHKDAEPSVVLRRCALAEHVAAPATKRRDATSKTEAEGVASEDVVVPATRRKAAVSKTEPMMTRRKRAAERQTEATGDVPKEVVPSPTTRELDAEDKLPMARVGRTATKALVTKTDTQQEEVGEGTQGVVSDVKPVVLAMVSDVGEGGGEPDDTKEAMNPAREKRNEVAEESMQKEEEILGAPVETATPMEEETPLAEDSTDNSSVQDKCEVDVEQRQDLQIVMGLVEQQERAPSVDIARIREEPLHDEAIHHTCEETEIVSIKEEAHASLKSLQDTIDLNEEPTFSDASIEDDGVMATDHVPQSSATIKAKVDVVEEVFTVNDPTQFTEIPVECVVEDSAFTGDLPPVLSDVHNTSPFSPIIPDDTTKSVFMDSDIVEAKVCEEAVDVSPCMYKNSKEQIVSGSMAAGPYKEVSKSEAMGNLSLRKLRLKFKETVAVGQENEVQEGKKKSMDSFTLKPYVSEEASDVSLCVSNNSNEKNITESVTAEQEKGVKQGNKSEGIGELSLRKLRLKMKQKVGQENEVKEVKKSMALDKLSLRQLRTKLKEKLNAHKSREPNRVPLGRLDENVC